MAPKRQQLVGSSSGTRPSSGEDSNSGGEMEKFVTPEAETEYNRLLSKGVVRERMLLSSKEVEMVAMIRERGWALLCEFANAVPLNIVQEFYANAKVDKNNYTVMRGMSMDYTPRAIHTLIGQRPKPRGVEDWATKTREDVDLDAIVAELSIPGTVWKCRPGTTEQRTFPASSLTRFARAWFIFICSNILPSSHVTDVTVERAILLWAF